MKFTVIGTAPATPTMLARSTPESHLTGRPLPPARSPPSADRPCRRGRRCTRRGRCGSSRRRRAPAPAPAGPPPACEAAAPREPRAPRAAARRPSRGRPDGSSYDCPPEPRACRHARAPWFPRRRAGRAMSAAGVSWDLATLYAGPDDPSLETDLREAQRAANDFGGRYRGRVATLAPDELAVAIAEYEAIEERGRRPSFYASLLF